MTMGGLREIKIPSSRIRGLSVEGFLYIRLLLRKGFCR